MKKRILGFCNVELKAPRGLFCRLMQIMVQVHVMACAGNCRIYAHGIRLFGHIVIGLPYA